MIKYHIIFTIFGKVISKYLYRLLMNEKVEKTFTPGPEVYFRCARKLSSYVLRSKFYSLERLGGSFKCKRCQVCFNVKEMDSFMSAITNKKYKINHMFSCSDKCLIYLLTFEKCQNPYVGKTVHHF